MLNKDIVFTIKDVFVPEDTISIAPNGVVTCTETSSGDYVVIELDGEGMEALGSAALAVSSDLFKQESEDEYRKNLQ